MNDSTIRRGRVAPFATVPEWIIVAPITAQALALYVTLAAHVNHARGDGQVWPGLTAVAAMLGFQNRRSLSRYVKELTELGAIDVHREITGSGWRQVYTVHEVEPQGYSGAVSIGEFHKQHREHAASKPEASASKGSRKGSSKGSRNPSTMPSATPSAMAFGEPSAMPSTSDGWIVDDGGHGTFPKEGRNSQVATGRNSQRATGRNPGVAVTRRTKPDEGEPNEGCAPRGTGSGRPPASRSRRNDAQTKGGVVVLRGEDLIGLKRGALTKKLTSVWTAVLRQHGGEAPLADTAGWDHDGSPRSRGEHPVGGQLKRIFAGIDDEHFDNTDWLDSVLKQVHAHARTYAETHPAAA